MIEGSTNDTTRVKETVLGNRGIAEVGRFLNTSSDEIFDYNLLDNMDKAVTCMLKHIENNSVIHIVVDPDADGICSAAMVYNYLKKAGCKNLFYSMHWGKSHGLSHDITIPRDTKLIILPDSGTNDFAEHQKYHKHGVDIIVLDHHTCDEGYSEHAIVVNNQLSKDYPNKDLSGAGIVYKFLQALDDELWLGEADNYLDLVAVANIGDMMDSRSLETRYYMNKGLGQIKSNAIKAFINKVEDRMGKLTLIGVAFYVVPLINAMIRVGSSELKELMFRAFCDMYEEFDYTKRDKSVIKENIYDRVARECSNAKGRQDTQKKKVIAKAAEYIDKAGLSDSKIIMLNAEDLEVAKELTGLMANGLAEIYRRPVLIYKKHIEDTDDGKVITYGGSARNFDGFELNDLRSFLLDTGLFISCQGHPNAFGIEFDPKNELAILNKCNLEFAKYSTDNYTYFVDFILDFENLEDTIFHEMDKLKGIYGQKVDEPLWAIKNVEISLSETYVNRGKTMTNIKAMVDGIEFVQFRVREDNWLLQLMEDWEQDGDTLLLDVVGTIGINSFAGKKTFQVKVEDWKIVEK